MRIVVNRDICTGCGLCIESCPYDAIVMVEERALINEYCQLCRACMSACPEGAIKEIETETVAYPGEDISSYRGVLVFAEQRGGRIAEVSLELLGIGRVLSEQRGASLSAALFGASSTEAESLIHWGAETVYHAEDPLFEHFNDEPYTDLLCRLIEEHKPEIVLAGATPIGRSFFPRVAARLRTGLTADCTSLQIDKETGNLLQIRPAFGGNIMATIVCPDHRPQMATVRPRIMKKGGYDESRKGVVVNVGTAGLLSRTTVIGSVKEESTTSINLQEAEVIVSGGRGVGKVEGFRMLEELALLLNGVVGASRAAVDEGWIPYSHQVGQTGKTVCPKVYIACGISGAVQHLVGMQSSDTIIAINKNPDAPIFGIANYGIVGDVYEVVPAIIKRIKGMLGKREIETN